MKKIMVIFAFAAVLTLFIGCGEEKVVEFRSLQQRGGVYVVPETQKPYSGKFVETHGNNVMKAGSFKKGKLHGETTTYREDGSINKIETFAEDVLNGKWEEYYGNGQIKRTGHYKDDKEDGKREEYYENGKLSGVEHYKDGERDGKCEEYYENGKFVSVGHYKDGKQDGKWESYDENGKLKSVKQYKDGEKDGRFEEYSENGQLRYVQHYKGGKRDGKWEYYNYENGKLMRVEYYKDDKRDGKREFYDENGKQILGSFSDQRDGKSYATVKIGTQIWMAENLNYDAKGSMCYGDKPANCEEYGRLYNWSTSLKACPSGWHLPSYGEWQKLVDIAGGNKVAGTALKATSGWNGNGTDQYGFSALPGGYRGFGYSVSNFIGVGYEGYWWSATENLASAYYQIMHYRTEDARWNFISQSALLSVRCVQDKVHSGEAPADSQDETVKETKGEYKTVKIGTQTWMAENLNSKASGSVCYNNDPEACEKCGRLYDWNTAMKACPSGWRLPSKEEWATLGDAASGTELKSKSGWDNNGNGTDKHGFSALPCGRYYDGKFLYYGSLAQFWSATENDANYAWGVGLDTKTANIDMGNLNKILYLRSVRCIQN